MSRLSSTLVACALLACALGAHAAPPDPGDCPAVRASGETRDGGQDSAALVLKEGMVVRQEGLLALRSLLPDEIWRHRDVFFFEGMLLEIGPCHRRYAMPDFYREATQKHAGAVSLDKDGDLRGYTAGIPFPQDQIDPDAPDAATKWAWNLEKRFRGAGARGAFRITTIPSRGSSIIHYRGDFFLFQMRERSDLVESGYAWQPDDDKLWAVGGYFSEPFSARDLAWRQFRKVEVERRWREPDDIFVYVPSMRKTRRAGTSWVDGAFVPRFSVAGQTQGGGGVVIGEGAAAVSPGAGTSTAVSEDARAGLTGLLVRPNAFRWRMLGETTVIAPLNGRTLGYPQDPERNYGYSGLAVSNDRWDVRRAVVIEGALRQTGDTIRTLTVYVDYQTLHPLYWITRTSKRRLVEVGILVHRFSADHKPVPHWPGGKPAYVFEPVAASFFDALAGRGGWLRESYDVSSLPFEEAERKEMSTTHPLQRGH